MSEQNEYYSLITPKSPNFVMSGFWLAHCVQKEACVCRLLFNFQEQSTTIIEKMLAPKV